MMRRAAHGSRRTREGAGKPVYIFMHHPPFDIGHDLMDLIKLDDAGRSFAASCSKGHDIRHIFFGHAHRTISGQWRGISFSALPSLNHQLPLVSGSVETVYSDEPPMYAAVTSRRHDHRAFGCLPAPHDPAQMMLVQGCRSERGNWYLNSRRTESSRTQLRPISFPSPSGGGKQYPAQADLLCTNEDRSRGKSIRDRSSSLAPREDLRHHIRHAPRKARRDRAPARPR
jgi:hypothetical protein